MLGATLTALTVLIIGWVALRIGKSILAMLRDVADMLGQIDWISVAGVVAFVYWLFSYGLQSAIVMIIGYFILLKIVAPYVLRRQ